IGNDNSGRLLLPLSLISTRTMPGFECGDEPISELHAAPFGLFKSICRCVDSLLSDQQVPLRGVVLSHAVPGVWDTSGSRVRRRAAFCVDNAKLPPFALRIIFEQLLEHFIGAKTLLEQIEPIRPIPHYDKRLRCDGSDAGFCKRAEPPYFR